MRTMSFTKACAEFFGRKTGQSLKEFSEELKSLTDKDRADLSAMFPSVGITIEGAMTGA